MSLPTIINTIITRNTTASQRASFGIPLFVYDAGSSAAPDVDFGGSRTRVYTSVDSMVDDGFGTTSDPVKAATSYFSQNPAVSQLVIGQYYSSGASDTDYVAALTEIRKENDSWYVLTADTHVEADVIALAAYIEAQIKLYFVSTSVAASIDTAYVSGSAAAGDIAGKLADANYTRTAHLWHNDADTTFPECAFAGHNLPYLAGAATWAFMQLNGVTVSKNAAGNALTDTQITNITARSSNIVVDKAGTSITWEGVVASGEYLDIMRGVDAMKEDMDKSLLDLLLNQRGGKVPMTDAGLNQVRNVMDSVLTRWVNRGFIQANYTITIPAAINIPFADKASRIVRDIKFEAYLQGAIHRLDPISGNVTYEAA